MVHMLSDVPASVLYTFVQPARNKTKSLYKAKNESKDTDSVTKPMRQILSPAGVFPSPLHNRQLAMDAI